MPNARPALYLKKIAVLPKAKHFALPLLLALAGGGLRLAAATPTAYGLPETLDPAASSGWVLADLDGNNTIDLATAAPSTHHLDGYSQEVRVDLGDSRQTSFHFQTSSATIALSSRDVDGDHDRDLVVLEPLSREPIGIWLNDGGGSFHEGNLADFAGILSHPTSGLVSPDDRIALLAIAEDQAPSTPRILTNAPPRAAERLAPAHGLSRPLLLPSDSRSRAPPCRG
jgi:hypothetical protein